MTWFADYQRKRDDEAARTGAAEAKKETPIGGMLHEVADVVRGVVPIPRDSEERAREHAYHTTIGNSGGGGGGGGAIVGGLGVGIFLILIAVACIPVVFIFWPCLPLSRKTLQKTNSVLWKVHPLITVPLALVVAYHFCFPGGLFNVIFAAMLLSAAIEMGILSRGLFVVMLGAMNALLPHLPFIYNYPDQKSLILSINVWSLSGVGVLLLWLVATTDKPMSKPFSVRAKTICGAWVAVLAASSAFFLWNHTRTTSADFPVTVDYDQTVREMIKAGKYDGEYGPASTSPDGHYRGRANVDIVLVHISRSVESNAALRKLEEMHLRPVSLRELLAFGATYPEQQREFPIIALDSVRRDASRDHGDALIFCKENHRYFSYLYSTNNQGWVPACRFAAVRK